MKLVLPAKAPRVWADAVQLREAFANLIGNAVNYLDKEPGRVEVTWREDGDFCVFCVADNGPGVPEAIRERVFEPFVRGPGAAGRRPGTGLGLYFVRTVVEQGGGRVWLESTAAEGSRFFFTMPRRPPADFTAENAENTARRKEWERHGPFGTGCLLPRASALSAVMFCTRGLMSNPSRTPIRLLIVDDDEQMRGTLVGRFERKGLAVSNAGSGEQALEIAAKARFDVAVLDLHLPGINGVELLEKLKERQPDLEALLLTAHSSVETAVAAMKKGAYDYLLKPFHLPELEVHIQKAYEKVQLARREQRLVQHLHREEPRHRLVGSSPAIKKIAALIEKVAPTDATVLVRGPSGTGKEVVARAIHAGSPRRDSPLVTINCAALQESLLESELFGHEKGAFTGAVQAKPGLVEVAEGGTLFIDEIGEMAVGLQAKLLRVLEDGHFRRVGGTTEQRADVRVVAATNRCAGGRDQGEPLPRGPVLPAQRHHAAAAAAARAAVGHPRAGRVLSGHAAGGAGALPGGSGGAGGAAALRLAGQRARAGQRAGAGADPGGGRDDHGGRPAGRPVPGGAGGRRRGRFRAQPARRPAAACADGAARGEGQQGPRRPRPRRQPPRPVPAARKIPARES